MAGIQSLLSKQAVNPFLDQLESPLRTLPPEGWQFRSAQNSRRVCRNNDCRLSSAHINSYPDILIHGSAPAPCHFEAPVLSGARESRLVSDDY